MKQIDELTMNSIGFAILCNFPQFCGIERAKEASEQFRAIKEELLTYRTIGTPEELKTLLQEKTQQEQGCEYCDFSSGSCRERIEYFDGPDAFLMVAFDGNGVLVEEKINFCPKCGRKLDGGDT